VRGTHWAVLPNSGLSALASPERTTRSRTGGGAASALFVGRKQRHPRCGVDFLPGKEMCVLVLFPH
jgi:hypothetical protein